jgi:hypothetical protein
VYWQDGRPNTLLAISTIVGVPRVLERSKSPTGDLWFPVEPFIGDGIERTFSWPLTNAVFYRWR